MSRPMGVADRAHASREGSPATDSAERAGARLALRLSAALRSFWRWFTTGAADDPIARYHRTHPERAPLALTHPQRRRAYKRAADALRRRGRDGGTAA